MKNVRIAVGAGAALLILAALLPWAHLSAGILSATKSGTDGDGTLVLIIAILLAIAVAFDVQFDHPFVLTISTLAAGAMTMLIGIVNIIDVNNKDGITRSAGSLHVTIHASVGAGLVLTALVGAALFGLAVYVLVMVASGRTERSVV